MVTCSESPKKTTNLHLLDLDEYSTLSIFDELEFLDLIVMADTHIKFQQMIANRYMIPKYRIHEKLICFDIAEKLPRHNINIDAIYIGKYDKILRFLRNFGKFVKNLELSGHSFTIQENVQINHFVEKYCWNSLEKLSLLRTNNYLLSDTVRIFPKMKKLNIVIPEEIDNFQIHRIYPLMDSLTFASETFQFTSMLHTNLNLKDLTFDIIKSTENTDFSIACAFLRNNSQLHQLNLYRSPSFKLVKCASESLPHLITLSVESTLDGLSWLIDPIRFGSVKNFKIFIVASIRRAVDRFPITFDSLETLEILVATANDVPFDLIEQSVDLKFLSLPNTHWLGTFLRITNIIRHLPQLKVMKLKWTDDIDDMDTIRLINESEQLKEITFNVLYNHTRDSLVALIPNTWKIDHVQHRKIRFCDVFDITIIRECC